MALGDSPIGPSPAAVEASGSGGDSGASAGPLGDWPDMMYNSVRIYGSFVVM